MRQGGFDACHQARAIQQQRGGQLARHREAQGVHGPAIHLPRTGHGVVPTRRLQRPHRRAQPQVMLAPGQCHRRRDRSAARGVPGQAFACKAGGPLFAAAHQRHCTAAVGFGTAAAEGLADRCGVEVHRPLEH
jgi:hypothetical protein